MSKIFIVIACLAIFISCQPKSTSVHNDCEEYGYKGKVKQIRKTSFSKSMLDDISKISPEEEGDLNEIFYINSEGNIDSMITERKADQEKFSYTRVFHFKDHRRDSWEAFTKTNEKIMTGKINWLSDTQFEEKVFFPDGKLKAETATLLNENFRTIEIGVKAYMPEGALIQNSIQKLEHNKSGDISLVTTKNLQTNSTEVRTYQYLSKDVTGNPKQILVVKESDGTKTFVRLDYLYYE